VGTALAGGAWPGGSAAATNAALIGLERAFLGAGLPGRAWFRHEIYAPGLNTGYAPVPLPRLGQAVLDKDPAAYAAGVEPIRAALERAAAAVDRAR
jgi:N-acetylated-alpha-linked acidic dipeptidase